MTDSNATVEDVYPSLTYEDAATAIDWLCRAFGFERRLVVPGAQGRIDHSELSCVVATVLGEALREFSNKDAEMLRFELIYNEPRRRE